MHDDWDQYPVVRYLLTIWDATERYVGAVIEANYASRRCGPERRRPADVDRDVRRPGEGNVSGLPLMDGKAALKDGDDQPDLPRHRARRARFNQTANPDFTFVANFPPCLQDRYSAPRRRAGDDTGRLLASCPTPARSAR